MVSLSGPINLVFLVGIGVVIFSDTSKKWVRNTFWVCVLLLLLNIIVMSNGALDIKYTREAEFIETRTLKTLTDSFGLEGNFVFATGSLSSKYEFHFFEIQEDGAFVHNSLGGANTFIYEHEGDWAEVRYIKYFSECFTELPWYLGCGKSSSFTIRNEFHVPFGTVVSGVNLDLE